jgi:hypothetical protein
MYLSKMDPACTAVGPTMMKVAAAKKCSVRKAFMLGSPFHH